MPPDSPNDFPASEARLRDRIRELEREAVQRRRSREALRVREHRLVEAQRIARLGSWEWDVMNDEVFWSDEMYRLFGVARDQLERTYEGFLRFVHPEDRGLIRERIGATFKRNERFLTDFRIVQPAGAVRHLRTEAWLERNVSGCPIRLIGTCQDITDQRKEETERQQLLDQVQRARRLEGLAVLAEGLANDFKNLLTAITGQIELARAHVSEDSEVSSYLDQIEETVVRSTRLTDRLSACSGNPPARWESVDLNEVVKRSVDDFDRRLTLHASVRYDLLESLPGIRGDFDQLCQVLAALVENAGQSILGVHGSILVATGIIHVDSAHLAGAYLAEDLPEGAYAYLRVADNGCGFDEVASEHVFDPFYSTKGPGRGLGLAWVAGVVRSHRGAIIVDSEAGRGSTFTVMLPVVPVSDDEVGPSGESAGDEAWKGNGTVVVVDDEPAVRSVIKLLVERRGFDVVLARDGVEGLDIIARTQPDLRAVLLDVNMPRMSGEEMFGLLRKDYPDLPVVVMTGSADHGMVDRLRRASGVRVLQKPFRAAALMDHLRAVLIEAEEGSTVA